jgi:hypothetical protein
MGAGVLWKRSARSEPVRYQLAYRSTSQPRIAIRLRHTRKSWPCSARASGPAAVRQRQAALPHQQSQCHPDGNLQYLPLNGALAIKAGETVRLTFGCSPASPSCLSSFSLVAASDQYAGGALVDVSKTGGVTPLNADLVFISDMDKHRAAASTPAR